ncbi:MAG: substrate-binding domain-containing protein [Opitutales bacterium]|nr:substrate-binding domain-containing protein [Opitutales bacterium]
MKSLPRKKNIYVALNAAYEHQRGIQRGILRFALAEPSWRLMNVAHEGQLGHEFRRVEKVDGVIGNFSDIDAEGEALRLVRLRGIRAVVSVSARSPVALVPRIIPDDERVGALAAEFFLQSPFRHFAYYAGGMQPPHWAAVRRGRAFRDRLARDGYVCRELEAGTLFGRDPDWPKPCALFVFNTHEARVVLESLLLQDVLVPEEVALLGVDQDPWQQQLSPLSLSAVVLDTERIGFQAAALLKRLMEGETVPSDHEESVPPLRIDVAASTEATECPDEFVGRALALIRRDIARLSSVEDCALLVGASRRKLERRTRAALGKTVYAVMQSARVDYAKRLLLETDLKLADVAAAAGFADGRMLSVVFQQFAGEAPSSFRRRAGAHPSARQRNRGGQ